MEHAVCSAWAENDFHCPAISLVISLLVNIATLDYVIHFAWANEMQRSESESSSPFGEIFLSVRHALIANLKPFLSRSSTIRDDVEANAICMFTFASLQNKTVTLSNEVEEHITFFHMI